MERLRNKQTNKQKHQRKQSIRRERKEKGTKKMNSQLFLLLLLLLLVPFLSHAAENNVWTDTFAIVGLKSYHKYIDVNPGDKLVTIYYQNVPINETSTTQRVRFDTNDLLSVGAVVSTTVLFDKRLYYINLLNSDSHFCIFEHLYVKEDKSSFRLLPDSHGGTVSWVKSKDVRLMKTGVTLNATLTNHVYKNVNVYLIDGKSHIAQMWSYFALGYMGKGDFYDVNYYENAENGYPLRFEVLGMEGAGGKADVVFDVAATQFYTQLGVNSVFQDGLFNANVRIDCH
jgi:hypothetical protein